MASSVSSVSKTVGPVDSTLKPTYDKLNTIIADLKALKKRGGYSPADVSVFQDQIRTIENEKFKDGVFGGSVQTSVPIGQAVLASSLHRAYRLTTTMLRTTEHDPAYTRIVSELEEIEQALYDILHSGEQRKEELQTLQKRLDNVDITRKNNAFVDGAGKVLQGQGYLHDLLAHNYQLVEEIQSGPSTLVDESLSTFKKQLEQALSQLNALRKNRTVGLSAGELEKLRAVLVDVESHRVDGVFKPPVAAAGSAQNAVLKGQAYLSSLLHRAYRQLYLLEVSTEVAPEVELLAVQLEEIKATLTGFQRDKNYTPEQLRKIQHTLDTIDQQRKNNAFGVQKNSIPAGQAYLHGLLASCYDIAYRLTVKQ